MTEIKKNYLTLSKVVKGDIFSIFKDFGEVPLPKYIKRPPTNSDIEQYQTVYAENNGSVAAPTAGLHFTEEMIEKIMELMSQKGENHYRELTDNTSGLIDYFYEATPVQELGQLNIGSRPSHRNTADRSKQSIRAIPWVFGWSLSRHTLPAWYGLGSAIDKILNDDKENLNLLKNDIENNACKKTSNGKPNNYC